MVFLKRKWPAVLSTFLVLDLVALCVYTLWKSPDPIQLDLVASILFIPLPLMLLGGAAALLYFTWRDEPWR